MVAHRTLTPFVRVRILHPLPKQLTIAGGLLFYLLLGTRTRTKQIKSAHEVPKALRGFESFIRCQSNSPLPVGCFFICCLAPEPEQNKSNQRTKCRRRFEGSNPSSAAKATHHCRWVAFLFAAWHQNPNKTNQISARSAEGASRVRILHPLPKAVHRFR